MKDTSKKKGKFARILAYTLSLINDGLRERKLSVGGVQATNKAESKNRAKDSALGSAN